MKYRFSLPQLVMKHENDQTSGQILSHSVQTHLNRRKYLEFLKENKKKFLVIFICKRILTVQADE